jgi:5-methyltetrahydropteroyltriglutamate--homocysteine methyltransferase
MAATYRADQVGSLLRPREMVEAHAAFGRGELPLERLREIEDRAILAALDLQREVGIDVYSDGEYRRGSWAGDFADAVEGYVPGTPAVRVTPGPRAGATAAAPPVPGTGAQGFGRVIGQKLRAQQRLTAHESAFLKAHAPGPFKITMPTATYVVARAYHPAITDKVYGSRAAVLADAARIIQQEVAALVDEGVPYIQLDNPHYPDYIPDDRREAWRAVGIDPDHALLEDIEADNASMPGSTAVG